MKERMSLVIAGVVIAFLLVVDFLQVRQVQKCREEIALKDSVIQRELVSSFRLDYMSSCVATLIRNDRFRLENVEMIGTARHRDFVKEGPFRCRSDGFCD